MDNPNSKIAWGGTLHEPFNIQNRFQLMISFSCIMNWAHDIQYSTPNQNKSNSAHPLSRRRSSKLDFKIIYSKYLLSPLDRSLNGFSPSTVPYPQPSKESRKERKEYCIYRDYYLIKTCWYIYPYQIELAYLVCSHVNGIGNA